MPTAPARKALVLCAALILAFPASAHVGDHPSVHDTVANILERIRRETPLADLRSLKRDSIESILTAEEREILGTEHISFRVNVPVTVHVVRTPDPKETPFWLEEREFTKTDLDWSEGSQKLSIWRKDFGAGWVGLGINSIQGGGRHYLVALTPKHPGEAIEVTELYPGQLRAKRLENGAKAYVDRDDVLESVPQELRGSLLIQTRHGARDAGKLVDVFRFTEHPATDAPDQIVLTWSGDPRTRQSIQWRTAEGVRRGLVRFQKKADLNPLLRTNPRPKEMRARTEKLEAKFLANDPVVNRHTVVLTNLTPDTTYVYSVGYGKKWSEPAEFTTAPDRTRPFSFIYMGDAQNGLDRWGTLLKNGFRARPDAAFYIMAGDLVNRGADRDDWDELFYNAAGVYDRRQLVPAIGNHECQGGHPSLYLKLFDLPKNGPPNIERERAYSFEYSNALFVVLDSNLSADSQTEWLEEQLAASGATWKFVVYHHPAYSSAPRRDNTEIRKLWTAIFDKYHVDLALQGHDHAYLRTYPMKGDRRAGSPAEGTIYIVSVSGTKLYDQDKRDYTEFGMTNVSTYQVLDIQISGDRLVYRAYDIDGKVRDEFVIEKPAK